MGFSDKMRGTLGSEGARVKFVEDDEGWAARASPGGAVETKVQIAGGTKAARVEGLELSVIVRHRHWSDGEGLTLTEAQANELDDRRHLMPAWSSEVLGQLRVDVGTEIEANGEHEVAVNVTIPEHCDTTTNACTITLLAQADIRGQIDPTATGRLYVGA